jgi:ABC-type multidrug transport system fused ATPase/permease subunit
MIPPYISKLYRGKQWLLARYFITSFGKAGSSVLLVVLVQQFLAISHHSRGKLIVFLESHFGAPAVPTVLTVSLLAVQLLGALIGYDNRIAAQHASEILEIGVMEQLIRKLLTLSLQFFNRLSEGDLIQTVRADVNNLTIAVNAWATLIRAVAMAIGLTVAAFWLSPLLAFVSLILLPLVGLPMVTFTSRHLRVAYRRLRSAGPGLFDSVLQMIRGIRIIKAYAAEEAQATISINRGKTMFSIMMTVVRLNARMQVLLEAVGGFSLVAVITVGGYELTKHRMSWDNLVAFVFATRSLFAPLSDIQTSYTSIQAAHTSVERINALLNEKPEMIDGPDALPLPEAPAVITFEDVGFSYEGAGSPRVLENISFSVRSGETIGIVGPSGVGKSTLLNLIVRFHDPVAGRVTFDGTDLRDYRLADVYRQTAIVTQEPFLFGSSVMSNIRCGRPEATDEEVYEAARGAFIHEEIMALPEGYETLIGMNGRQLSRGQAQRVNVARALLRNSKLLILDEATASLDSVAEHQVQLSIDRLMQGRTCFIVAHRLSTLRNADRLIVLDHGECVGIGTHSELIRNCALYRTFWELQRLREAEVAHLTPVSST